jgi:hypothetical protein
MRRSVLRLFCFCAGVVALGFLLCFPFFSFLPLIWSACLVSAFLLYFVACLARRRDATPVRYWKIGLVYTVAFVAVTSVCMGVKRVERHACVWKEDEGVVEVDLSPVGGFGTARVSSSRLAEHLRKDHPKLVSVVVLVVRDFGYVRARGPIEVVDGIRVHELD